MVLPDLFTCGTWFYLKWTCWRSLCLLHVISNYRPPSTRSTRQSGVMKEARMHLTLGSPRGIVHHSSSLLRGPSVWVLGCGFGSWRLYAEARAETSEIESEGSLGPMGAPGKELR